MADANAIDFDSIGATIPQFGRRDRLFKITGGTNPYSATEVWLKESTGVTADNAGWPATVANKSLWEVNGVTTVAVNVVVIGFPNPFGGGFIFDSDPASGAALNSQNTDGTQVNATTTNLRFNKTTGVQVTQAAGISTVTGINASATQIGVVNLSNQEFLGVKSATGWGVGQPSFGCYLKPWGTGVIATYSTSGGIGTPDNILFWAGALAAVGEVGAGTGFRPPSRADAAVVELDIIYFSTTLNKLVYKDIGGTINALY